MITRRLQNKNSWILAPLGEGKFRTEQRLYFLSAFNHCFYDTKLYITVLLTKKKKSLWFISAIRREGEHWARLLPLGSVLTGRKDNTGQGPELARNWPQSSHPASLPCRGMELPIPHRSGEKHEMRSCNWKYSINWEAGLLFGNQIFHP